MDVFGYASLTDHDGRVASLPGYRCVWGVAMDNGRDIPGYKYYLDATSGERPAVCVVYLDLAVDATRQVPGVVFEASSSDLEELDQRERNYGRESVVLSDGSEACAYFGLGEARRRCAAALKGGGAVVDRNYLEAVRDGFRRLDALAQFEASAGQPPCPVVDLRRVDL